MVPRTVRAATSGILGWAYRTLPPNGGWIDAELQAPPVNSANLLTGRVRVTEFSAGVPTRKHSRPAKIAAPQLESFDFEMFAHEP